MTGHRIFIIDDHPLFRDALKQALTPAIEGAIILEADSLDAFTNQLSPGENADLVLLDLAMPGVNGLSGLLFIRSQYSQTPVVIVSASEEPAIIARAIEFGASGYITKSLPVDQIRRAVALVLDGEIWTPPGIALNKAVDQDTADMAARLSTLTPQQARVLMMLGEGLLNKQIAYELGVSEATIKAHVSAILQKLKVDSRTQAVIAINRIDSGIWQKPVD